MKKGPFLAIAGAAVIIAGGALLATKAKQAAERRSCLSNMKQLDGAITQLAFEQRAAAWDKHLPEADIADFLKDGRIPHCPSGGKYVIPPLGGCSICSHHGDLLMSSKNPSDVDCYSQLRLMAVASLEIAEERGLLTGDLIPMDELGKRLPDKQIPKCPNHGTYLPVKVGTIPECSVDTNEFSRALVLPEHCGDNLRMIESAIARAAKATGSSFGQAIPEKAILDELPYHRLPICPDGGKYSLQTPSGHPECSKDGDPFKLARKETQCLLILRALTDGANSASAPGCPDKGTYQTLPGSKRLACSYHGDLIGRAQSAEACLANLKQLDAVIVALTSEKGYARWTPVPTNEIGARLKGGRLLTCPVGGTYGIPRAGEHPSCSYHFGLLERDIRSSKR